MQPTTTDVDEIRRHLSRFPIWSDVSPVSLTRFCAYARLHTVPNRRPLFLCERPGAGLFLVRKGEFKVTLISAEGREQILYLADTGKLITEAYSPLEGISRCSAFARENAEAWEFPSHAVRDCIQEDPQLALAVQESMAFRTNRHIDLIFQLSLLSVERRLAAFILELARRNRATPGLPFVLNRDINVSTVACLLGTVREEVTRAQTRLQKKGIVEINRREVIVHDLGALERLVTE